MPELDLCRLSVSDATLYVLAVIHCPCDLDEQAKLFARLQNDLVRQELNKPSRVPMRRSRERQAAASNDILSRRDSDRTRGARICVFMFLRVLIDGVSLHSAVEELGTTFKHELGAQKSACWAAWRKFRPAVHLGAAFYFWNSDLMNFLTIAEELRRRGEAHPWPEAGREWLLEPAEMWKVPASVPLPPLPDTFEMPPRGFYFKP